jgi:hypothetical protein
MSAALVKLASISGQDGFASGFEVPTYAANRSATVPGRLSPDELVLEL